MSCIQIQWGRIYESSAHHLDGVSRHNNTLQHTATHCNTLQHTATRDGVSRSLGWGVGIRRSGLCGAQRLDVWLTTVELVAVRVGPVVICRILSANTIQACDCMYVYTYTHTNPYICINTYPCICVYMYLHGYVYIHMYMYMCIYRSCRSTSEACRNMGWLR